MEKQVEENINQKNQETTTDETKSNTLKKTEIKEKIKKSIETVFSLEDNRASNTEIRATMTSGAKLKGPNMCILVLAIIIACVGLNMNSTAIVIGAMLISPLMGCILGIGYGFATNDLNFAKKSFIGLLIEVIICIITSTIYFLISPISTACHELLARTSPTIWDVLVATAGGLAGVIGLTRKEKSNVIPGVAIATAIMPPLCTAGYGIATWQFTYFLGALYLFFINAFFICLSTVIVLKLMKLPKKKGLNEKEEKKLHRNLFIVAVITIVPSVILATSIVNETVLNNNIQDYLAKEFNYENTQIVKSTTDLKKKEIDVAVIGNLLDEEEILNLTDKLSNYGLQDMTLKINQTEISQGITSQEIESAIEEKLAVTEDPNTISKNSKEIEDLKTEILTLKAKLLDIKATTGYDSTAIKAELKQKYSKILDCTITSNQTLNADQTAKSEKVIVTLTISQELTENENNQIESYLKDKIGDNVTINKKAQ